MIINRSFVNIIITKEDTSTSNPVETTANELAIDMTIANDKSIPLEEHIAKIATDIF
ncbi:hypothetical protein [Lysinibacillus fusiformis]|uniref:hypothetical protein n=1 Tax=Lysinibacillus fusiformis TaxID=28031 RepID=UPI003809441B